MTKQTSLPPVSVVIPTYNGQQLLQKHLPAVLKAVRSGDELVIVDDASDDTTCDFLVKKFGLKQQSDRAYTAIFVHQEKKLSISMLCNATNLRFSRAANKGVAAARHQFVFLLNNDVSPAPDALQFLLPHFENKKVFAVTCKEVVNSDGTQTAGKNRLWFERGFFVHSRAAKLTTGQTAWASGGSSLFSKKKWLELGGFDSRFQPAYWEDIDISYRARKKGWEVLFDQQAKVKHVHETTNTKVFGSKQSEINSFVNSIRFFWKHASLPQIVQHFIWLPYHLVVTQRKTKGIFLEAYWRFLAD